MDTQSCRGSAFQELRLSIRRNTLAWDPNRRALYFSATAEGTSAVWRLDLDPVAHTLTGGPHRVAMMAEDTSSVSIARATGAIAFAAVTRNPRLSWYPLDPSGRRLARTPERLTSGDLPPSEADVAADGSRFIFSVRRPVGPTMELRTKVRAEEVERSLRITDSARGERRQHPRLSSDGKRIVFRYVMPEGEGPGRGLNWMDRPQQLRLLDVDGGDESNLTAMTTRLVMPGGFSPDGRLVLASIGQMPQQNVRGMAIALLPLAAAPNAESQMRIVTSRQGQSGLLGPVMAPNGRWIAFEVQEHSARIAVLGSSDGLWNQAQPESSWRYVDPTAMYDPRWSVDGRLLYFASQRGGLANVWAVDFDPTSGAMGEPFQITEFTGEDAQMPLAVSMTGVARGGLVLHTVHPIGGIWLMHGPR